MYNLIENKAKEFGFARAYFTPLYVMEEWREAALAAGIKALPYDLPALYPWAKCMLLLVHPYLPFAREERIPAYYLAQQRAYLSTHSFAEAIDGMGGYRFEYARNVPVRAMALHWGIGVQGKNGLLRLSPYGARIVLHAVATDACTPRAATDMPTPACPPGCDHCACACPAGAIGERVVQKKCMRFHMSEVPYPSWVETICEKFLGCEICMDACPENAGLALDTPSAAVREAFSLQRLAAGDTAAACALTGKNFKAKARLAYQARLFQEKV